MTALRHHVAHVVELRSEEQVIGPDTRGVVTGVQDGQALGDRAVLELPGEAMGHLDQATLSCS